MAARRARQIERSGSWVGAQDSAEENEMLSEFKDAFDQIFDVHQRHHLTKADLRDLFKRHCVRVTDEQIEQAFTEADHTGDGVIDFAEFAAMMSRRMRQTSTEEKLMNAFRVFDPESTGFIDTKVLSEALTTLGDRLNPKELNELLAVAENAEGKVKYDLFVNEMFAKNKKS
ncbi:Regulatory myosin light chain [Pelomyxa schiedti]|nr:Regulatory myosin light chain [Pelomyxa schiedti]